MTLALFASNAYARLLLGKSERVLPSFSAHSVDAVVTDPPSSIGFMKKDWDNDKGGRVAWVKWLSGVLAECVRILKPGGHALVWSLPRRSHWTGLAIEDAGFEIRDRITHLFGEGMPKSPHVLKPAAEDWWLARAPLEGTATATIERYATGGLNIDQCRIEGTAAPFHNGTARSGGILGDSVARGRWEPKPDQGRWPAHVTLDETAAALLDEQSGIRRSGAFPQRRSGIGYAGTEGYQNAGTEGHRRDTDVGAASRFFYVAKAREDDKTEGGAVDNDHETVKSTPLMRWLVRLVTPTNGIVLDPFAGSGTTGVACAQEGRSFIGIEQNTKHHATALARLQRSFARVEAV